MEQYTSKYKKSREIDIITAVENIGKEINDILDRSLEDKYFYALVLNYSFIENILKHIEFTNLLWKQISQGKPSEIHPDIVEILADRCINVTFDRSIHNVSRGSLKRSKKLLERLRKIQRKRNSLIHQLWLHESIRNNPKILRKELEEILAVSNALINKLSKMEKEMGVLDLYYPEEWVKEKHLIKFK